MQIYDSVQSLRSVLGELGLVRLKVRVGGTVCALVFALAIAICHPFLGKLNKLNKLRRQLKTTQGSFRGVMGVAGTHQHGNGAEPRWGPAAAVL